jgi:hypothetical protein
MPDQRPSSRPCAPFDHYGTERGASENFENRVTVLSNYSLLNNDYLTPASWATMPDC